MVWPICDLPPLSESLRDSESHLNAHSRGHAGPHGGMGVLYSCALQQIGGLVLNKAKHRGTEEYSEVLFGYHPSSYEQLFYRDH